MVFKSLTRLQLYRVPVTSSNYNHAAANSVRIFAFFAGSIFYVKLFNLFFYYTFGNSKGSTPKFVPDLGDRYRKMWIKIHWVWNKIPPTMSGSFFYLKIRLLKLFDTNLISTQNKFLIIINEIDDIRNDFTQVFFF